MLTMAVGHSDDVDAGDAIAAAIAQCKAALAGTEPQVGILFAGFDGFDPGVVAAVRQAFPSAHIVGCTSSAELLCSHTWSDRARSCTPPARSTTRIAWNALGCIGTLSIWSGFSFSRSSICSKPVAEEFRS